jgi:hypothetical protein
VVNSRYTWLVFASTLSAALGCGRPGTGPTAATRGVVRYKGEPATEVRVILTPASGRPAIGETNAQGNFVLTTFKRDDGAVPGLHKATISDKKRNWLQEPGKDHPASRFPEKYQNAAKTPWSCEIKAGEENVLELDMTD